LTAWRLMFQLEAIDHVALAVSDPERSADWYVEVLGFERKHDDVWNGRPIFLAKGKTGIALFHAHNGAPLVSSKSDHIGMTHFAFRGSRAEFLSAQRDLKSRGINFEFRDHKISHSIYFSDPDGIRLEITTYEVAQQRSN
jgi:catechol 2,3-dioxygenase-like lactoylglutathione lyase family enzyme